MTRTTNLITIIREIRVEQPDPDVTELFGDETAETDEDEIIDFAKLLAEFKARASTPAESQIAEDTTAVLTEPPNRDRYLCRPGLDFGTPYALLTAVRELYIRQRYKEASAFFQKRVEANPLDARSFFWLAHAQEKAGDIKECAVSFKKAAELDPGFIDSMFQLLSQDSPITTLDKEGLEKFLEDSQDASAHFLLAHKHCFNELDSLFWDREEEAWKTAESHFHKAIQLEPDFYPAYSALAFRNLQKGEKGSFDTAVEYINKIIDSDPGYAYAHIWLAACHLLCGDTDTAKKIIRKGPGTTELVKAMHYDARALGGLYPYEVVAMVDALLYGELGITFSVKDQKQLRLKPILERPPELSVGDCVGDYHLTEPISDRGQLCRVYKTTDKNGEVCAVKAVKGKWLERWNINDAFLEVAEKLKQLDHKSIARCFDYGVSSAESHLSVPYLVMEFFGSQYETLASSMRTVKVYSPGLGTKIVGKPLSLQESVNMLEQLASALAYAHEKGVYHGCIKPSDVFYDREKGIVKLADFGLNLILSQAFDEDEGALDFLTMFLPSCIHYLPREKLNLYATYYDEKSDIYSLGLVFYDALTGIITREQLERPSLKDIQRRNIPAGLVNLIGDMLSEDVEQIPSAKEVLERLKTETRPNLAKRIWRRLTGYS